MNLGETFDKFQKFVQESFFFSFSKLMILVKVNSFVCLHEAGL